MKVSDFEIVYKKYGELNTTVESIQHEEDFTEEEIMKKVNTWRLRGFAGHTIEVVSAKRLKASSLYNVAVDKNSNEVDVSKKLVPWLLDNMGEDLMDKLGEDVVESLEALGYEEMVHDNSYNYENCWDDTIDYRIYQHVDSTNGDWLYDQNALIFIRLHVGIDVRAGYNEFAVVKNGSGYDSLMENFYMNNMVQFYLKDSKGNEVESWDETFGNLELDSNIYQIVSEDTEEDIKVKRLEDGEILELYYY